ncbi:hypothetical protein [Acinetobacter bereziniae]|uniref:hypothetical protein n=1 Tax=Acinetobacter bereziniae TaxID=106648 RepID=UPI0018FF7D3A|nr:hypothetical protein [Acinetobacter bereziniae]MBJ8554221.1 hypothetical protein [Acinetobacter bereziniae]
MALLLLLPILVCGFLYLRIHQKHKHNLSKLEGHHLYFKSAFHGFIFTLLGFCFFSLINNLNEFKVISNFIKQVIIGNIYTFDPVPNSSMDDNELIDYKIKLTEKFKGLTTLNFYLMLIWTTIFSVVTIYLYVYISFFFRVLYEWALQKLKLFWNNIILPFFAVTLTTIKTFWYFIQLLIIMFLSFWHNIRIYSVLDSAVDTNLKVKQSNEKITIEPQSFISIWKSWKYGIVSISKEITDPLDQLLYKSIQSHQTISITSENQLFDDVNSFFNDKIKPIMLSMDDRKIYIGFIIGFGYGKDAFSIKNETFRLLPILSGYRDKDTLKVIKTTDYVQTIKDMNELKTIELILRKENIISATVFNFEHFKKFQSNQESCDTIVETQVTITPTQT